MLYKVLSNNRKHRGEDVRVDGLLSVCWVAQLLANAEELICSLMIVLLVA